MDHCVEQKTDFEGRFRNNMYSLNKDVDMKGVEPEIGWDIFELLLSLYSKVNLPVHG